MVVKDDNSQEINREKSGIYVHVPYCRKKCIYCDFFSGGIKSADYSGFVKSVLNELLDRREELTGEPATLYIGGGTPSLIPPAPFKELTEGIRKLTGKDGVWEEFTIEVNPEDVSDEMCGIWKDCGVNRLSMGIQTLDNSELISIGRRHDCEMALKALEKVKNYFDNVSVDLIFGLPGQTTESWNSTVEKIMKYKPEHISAYSLMFEEGTAITVLKRERRMTFPEEEECLKMWRILTEKLYLNGYSQYELSNYSFPGKESIHNKRYWLGNPYLGLGPSAHSYDGRRIRRANPLDIRGYLQRFSGSAVTNDAVEEFFTEERLSKEELMEEKIMLSLRMTEGLNLDDFRIRFGDKASECLEKASLKSIREGYLKKDGEFLRLTKKGIMISDEIFVDLCMWI